MSQQFDVVVIGGGIVGLTAALAMAEKDYSVAVLDAGSLSVELQGQDSRVYAINKASQALLTDLGVWAHLDQDRASSYDKMFVWDAANGAQIDFDSRIIAEQALGTILEESVIKQALLRRLANQANCHLFANTRVQSLDNHMEHIEVFSAEDSWTGRLLVVADGANSPTRELLQVPLTTWSYHQKALVATVATEKTHQHTAYQVFNPDGPLAFLPLKNTAQCSIVWSTTPERADGLMALDDEAFNEELARAFGRKLGEVQVLGKRFQFPLQMRHVDQYAGKGWLLMGDCAHTIHPLAGLGLNLGLADVRAWMTCLSTSKSNRITNKQLGSYQRERKHAVWQTIVLMEGFKRLFAAHSAPIKALRGFGLQTCNALPPLKRLFIEHAAGI